MEPTIAVRPASEIDVECLASARLYLDADKFGGLSQSTMLILFARVAALMWVLCPGESETAAQGKAWGLIAELRAGEEADRA